MSRSRNEMRKVENIEQRQNWNNSKQNSASAKVYIYTFKFLRHPVWIGTSCMPMYAYAMCMVYICYAVRTMLGTLTQFGDLMEWGYHEKWKFIALLLKYNSIYFNFHGKYEGMLVTVLPSFFFFSCDLSYVLCACLCMFLYILYRFRVTLHSSSTDACIVYVTLIVGTHTSSDQTKVGDNATVPALA